MHTYSQDLRERVVRACDERRGSRQQIAELFNVSTAWIRRLLQRRRLTGSFAARSRGGNTAVKMDAQRCGRLVVLVCQQPDATLAELRDRLAAPVHASTLSRTLTRLGLPRKKRSSRPPSTTVPSSKPNARAGAAAAKASIRTASSFSTKWAVTRA